MKILYIVRGLPGSGKSTLARALAPAATFAADDYFTDNEGNYHFDHERLSEAHWSCMDRTRKALESGLDTVAVANTFSTNWEMAPYRAMAADCGYSVCVLECQSQFGNVHGVPTEAIERMAARWEAVG